MDLIKKLEERFNLNLSRHRDIDWIPISLKIKSDKKSLKKLKLMEDSGGEPDVIKYDKDKDLYLFVDCSLESPLGRRSLCYDKEALDRRKKNKPIGSALEMAAIMGVEILSEDQYRFLQTLGNFDLKTSSWVKTPNKIRELGGALFCDFRYKQVFTYHNGADSYYSSRGFRSFFWL